MHRRVLSWTLLGVCLPLAGAGCGSEEGAPNNSVDTTIIDSSAGATSSVGNTGDLGAASGGSATQNTTSMSGGTDGVTSNTTPDSGSMTNPGGGANPGDAGSTATTVSGGSGGSAVNSGAGGSGGMPTSNAGAGTGGSGIDPSGGAGGSAAGGAAVGGGGAGTTQDPEMEWLPSWATTIQRTEDSNEPPPLGGKTLRQFVYPSFAGSEIRLQLSNERGNAAVEITKVHIAHAQPLGQGQIDVATDAEFTWGGSASVTIPQGETAWSDPLTFELLEAEPMAVTMHFSSAPSDVTGHPGARTTSYVADGDVVSEAGMGGAETRDRWYFLDAIEVMAPSDCYAVAVLGDSITDGYGVLNEFARWPDFLNLAINQDPMIADKVSVLNFGMGANSLTSGNADMDPGTERFERDVLGRQEKIRWLIVLIGVNDIIYGGVSANPITSAYQQIIDQSRAAGILVYGSPITPFASNTSTGLGVRTEVNSWITTSGEFDEVVDLAAAVADPANDQQLNPPLSNDGLHPNTAGYEAMGNAVDLSLFYQTMQ